MDTKSTKLLSCNDENIKIAADILKNGGLCGIPTETVYGLAGNAFDKSAAGKIFAAKGRPQDNPLIVHIADIADIGQITDNFHPTAQKLAEKFWPGPFTMILPKGDKIPYEITGGLDTVAVRIPAHETALKIIRAAGIPLSAPSANLSGSPSPTTAQHVMRDLSGRIDAVLDGGVCEVGVESTVITFVGETPKILRPGAITEQMLKDAAGDVIVDENIFRHVENNVKAASPGMKYKHYSPLADIAIISGDFNCFKKYALSHFEKGVFALCFEGEEESLSPIPCVSFGKESDAYSQASALFSALRELDAKKATRVYAREPLKSGVSMAVYNRLIRAAGFEVIDVE